MEPEEPAGPPVRKIIRLKAVGDDFYQVAEAAIRIEAELDEPGGGAGDTETNPQDRT